ncbi:hypothetical protein [Devosia sp.]|uniref:hypothetical protein n=1 Tax=Devosia sp. TaxID=1871048 RepID=UPI003A926048
MSKLVIAKNPDLSFLTTNVSKTTSKEYTLPIIITDGSLDWDANGFITFYSGGPNVYNIKPSFETVQKKSYKLNLFCSFLYKNNTRYHQINDSTLYQFTLELKKRKVNDSTIKSYIVTALEFVVYLNKEYPSWNLATSDEVTDKSYKVHYEVKKVIRGYRNKEYLSHSCLNGLINISTEIHFLHDDEFEKWLDAINVTSLHPIKDDFIVERWYAFGTLLEVTGSRISEVDQITRSMIKEASKDLFNPNSIHYIKNIPIKKGKYKGNKRTIKITKEDLQIILNYILKVEEKFKDITHDFIFVDLMNGKKLTLSYLKNYARKVINNSPYEKVLKHINNHSFRHRFITLQIAREIKRLSKYGSFANIISVASEACRKITMHASTNSLSSYVHLATTLNEKNSYNDECFSELSSQTRIRILNLKDISTSFKNNLINEKEALDRIISEIDLIKTPNVI